MLFSPLILVSGCVHATFCFRGRAVLSVLTLFYYYYCLGVFLPSCKARLRALLPKQNIVSFGNCASSLRLQLRGVFLQKFSCCCNLPLYVRNWGVNHSLPLISEASLVFSLILSFSWDCAATQMDVPALLPPAFTDCVFCWFLVSALEIVSIGCLGLV